MTSEAITVRDARRDDAAAVVELWVTERSAHASTPDSPEAVERLVDESPAALLVAEANGLVVGAVIAGWDGWRGNIYRLAVAAERRRAGIGLRLVRAAEERLRSRGAGRITALVAFDDEEAGAFWDEAGYPRDAEIGRRVRNV